VLGLDEFLVDGVVEALQALLVGVFAFVIRANPYVAGQGRV
jgi:hypothetical protein